VDIPNRQVVDTRGTTRAVAKFRGEWRQVSKEEERALWDAARVLLERNRSYIPKEASPASVQVVKMSLEWSKMQACNKADKEAA
jgi:hypothetical protein